MRLFIFCLFSLIWVISCKSKATINIKDDSIANDKSWIEVINKGTIEKIFIDDTINAYFIKKGINAKIDSYKNLNFIKPYFLDTTITIRSIHSGMENMGIVFPGISFTLNARSSILIPFDLGTNPDHFSLEGEGFFTLDGSERKTKSVNRFSIQLLSANKELAKLINLTDGTYNIANFENTDHFSVQTYEGKANFLGGQASYVIKEGNVLTYYNEHAVVVRNFDIGKPPSWMQNQFSFNNEPIREAMKVVGWYYRLPVVFKRNINANLRLTLPRYPDVKECLMNLNHRVGIPFEVTNHTIYVGKTDND